MLPNIEKQRKKMLYIAIDKRKQFLYYLSWFWDIAETGSGPLPLSISQTICISDSRRELIDHIDLKVDSGEFHSFG